MSITPESVKALLDSPDFGDRMRGVNQLRQLEPSTAFGLIKAAVVDSNTRVRYAAVSQLASLGQQDLAQSLELLRDRLLNDPETDVQAAAADSICALQLKEAFEDLQHLYHTTAEPLVQFSIIAALGELGDPRGLELLKTALNSSSGLVQTAAIGALGELGDREAIPLLLPYADNSDWQIRYQVAKALKYLGGPEAQTALATLAQDEVEQVAQEAQTAP
jgi:HEAT repeat protein